MILRCLALLAACLLASSSHAHRLPFRPLIQATAGAEPIQLQHLSVSAEISGGMAETTVRMVFFNPNGRLLEGKLQFPLLDGQHVTAFALDIDGALRPAVPVSKARGREVFEQIERVRVDPALLEMTQGNNFQLRIYPIGARASRTVELKYAEPLARRAGQWVYRLPLAYGAVQDLTLNLQVDGSTAVPLIAGAPRGLRFEPGFAGYKAHYTGPGFTPEGALEISVEAASIAQVYRQERDGRAYFLAEIPVKSTRIARPEPRVIGLLWDSSGSGAARARDAELAELDRYFKALGEVEVRLVRLRDRAEPAQAFRVRGGDWSALRRALVATIYDGASALNDWSPQADVDHYLLFSDGLANYGGKRFPVLASRQRLFALNSALSADTGRLAALAEHSGGALIAVNPATPGAAAEALLSQDTVIEQLSATGATDLEVESYSVRDGMLRVAGRMVAAEGQLSLTLSNGSPAITVALPAQAAQHPLAANSWATFHLQALEADHELHRAEIGRIGRQFGIPTRDTSLIVLERLDDYVRYDIEPPAAYKEDYDRRRQMRDSTARQARTSHLEQVVRLFERRTEWWNTRFPRKPLSEEDMDGAKLDMQSARMAAAARPAAPLLASPAPGMQERVSVTGSRKEAMGRSADSASLARSPSIGIALKKWVPNAPYMERLRSAPADRVYAYYLDEKPGYAGSSAFFLDVADILIDKGQRDLALRVLSNLAEMDLENRALLRILGYRLLQADAPLLAIPVFEKVLELAQEEPQSYRDLGLAYAAAGQPQQAIERLYEVVARPWHGRFPEIETIALAEINAIVARSAKPLDLRQVDPRLLKNLPLDLRVVMTWDADNSDMDLWVTDPNKELCNYAHALTNQGGRMSRDFTGGYGPEEFSLRKALPGTYRIQANYYGNRQQVLAGATTLQVKLFTHFGTGRQKEQVVTLRLKDAGETVFVGEFTVQP